MLRALLFDFGGTLDSDGVAWPERFLELYTKEKAPGTPEQHLDAFYRADESLDRSPELAGLDLEGTVRLQVDRAMARLGAEPGTGERIARAFVADSRRILARNRRVLEALASRFKLGVVSNFYGNLQGVLDAEGLSPLFGVVADSCVVGAVKPDPRIFRHALAALEVEPAEALMVGDSLKRDMRGAEGLGMPHAFLSTAGEPCCPGARTLRSLPELRV